jgi:hypothetical protein
MAFVMSNGKLAEFARAKTLATGADLPDYMAGFVGADSDQTRHDGRLRD